MQTICYISLSLPENQKVCWHFFSGPIFRSAGYSSLEDCAYRCLHDSKTRQRQAPRYSKVSSRSPRYFGRRTSQKCDFETSLHNFHLHQAREAAEMLLLPYLVMWVHFRVSKWKMTLPERMSDFSHARLGLRATQQFFNATLQ